MSHVFWLFNIAKIACGVLGTDHTAEIIGTIKYYKVIVFLPKKLHCGYIAE